MFSFETAEKLLKSYEQNKIFFWVIIIFLVLNLLGSAANILLQIFIKRRDNKNYRLKIREDRRIKVYEELYWALDEISYLDGRTETDLLFDKISSTDSYLAKNSLYTSKKMKKIVVDYLDYFRSTLTDFRKKDIQKEIDYTSKFIKEFNR